jgi:hypothetical protein
MTESELLDELRKFVNNDDRLLSPEAFELISIYGREQWEAGYEQGQNDWAEFIG